MSDIREISVPALAYLGDCVLELCVRRHLIEKGLSTSAHLNRAALDFVRAPAQAEAMKRILPYLTEEENAYFRRGRNMGHSNVPKRATVSEYRTATGMETLFGYLHLTAQTDRIGELFRLAYLQEDGADGEDGEEGYAPSTAQAFEKRKCASALDQNFRQTDEAR